MTDTDPCDDCGDPTANALARTIRLSVDGSAIDTQRLCPDCFATWIQEYREYMQPERPEPTTTIDDDIIVD
ncbi:DUF7569 family protein [Halocalculus aciditolerans]|uniref:Small CPxCG-related zinc finger protein n=1 Tax=Halocalculus aciditolerans TaxID=1383812 RepID=A0A830FES1_9EURY|nr:hypothetical protein [Halocalculus aciditolerans]GGL47996.1 hypothetical protein GCM10009039_02750 [Halocalculus aciditolerans]